MDVSEPLLWRCESDIEIPDFHGILQVDRLSTRPPGFGVSQTHPKGPNETNPHIGVGDRL